MPLRLTTEANNNLITLYKYDDPLIEFSLPGQGEPLDDCGLIGFRAHLDPDHHEIHYQAYTHSCHRFACPLCWTGWKSQESHAIFQRLKTYMKATRGDIIHWIISPSPRKILKLSDYKSLRTKMYKIARSAGIIGGVAIFHYFRHPSSKNDRTEICPDQPHWHLLADSYFYDGFRAQHLNVSYIKHGLPKDWIVKYVGVRRSAAQIYSTIDYTLTWASQVSCTYADLSISKSPKIEIETWFGIMSYSCFKSQKLPADGILCLVCGEIIRKSDWYQVNFLKEHPPDPYGSLSMNPAESPYLYEVRLTWSETMY